MPDSNYLITAIGTPLDADEKLHHEGLERHLSDQWNAGIDGILVGGSMGMMQMLRDDTYRALVARAVQFSHGRGEVLVGVGDVGKVRTLDRIKFACQYDIVGVVALAPYLFRVSQEQIIDYFRSLADESPVPLYVYDLPARTGVALDLNTYDALATHPNIRGAKVSGRIDIARELSGRFDGRFRVIFAEPQALSELIPQGFKSHLDGVFAVAPHWAVAVANASNCQDLTSAHAFQGRLNALLELLGSSRSVFGAFTAMMNARGIPGNFHAAPFPTLTVQERMALLAMPIMQELVTNTVVGG